MDINGNYINICNIYKFCRYIINVLCKLLIINLSLLNIKILMNFSFYTNIF